MTKIIYLDNIPSTNDYLLDHARQYAQEEMVVAVADFQTQGHGMGTNRWESQQGKNLLFSILVHPDWLDVQRQFLVSMAQALALRDVLAQYADDITIKWPNDIYWRDCKISGTRIDGNIKGRTMGDMVIGTGININQQEFHSDAPNPVSLRQITGQDHDRDEILQHILHRFKHYYHQAQTDADTLVADYHRHLYRRQGFHPYEDASGQFQARLLQVQPNGIMLLQRPDGTISQYEFKEVKFLTEAPPLAPHL